MARKKKWEHASLVRKRKKLFKGYLNQDFDFNQIEEVLEIDKVDNIEDFIPLLKFMKYKGENPTKKREKEILRLNQCQEMWVHDPPPEGSKNTDGMTATQWNKYWMSEKYHLCKTCKKSCKQSSRIEDLMCPDYEEKKS